MDLVRESEQAILEAGLKFAKAIGDFLPAEVPPVREVLEGIFSFTGEIMKTQREFTQRMGEVRAHRLSEESKGAKKVIARVSSEESKGAAAS